MEKYYTINELAMMTGLTTRTLRNYLKLNILCGEKVDGSWMFTEEDVSEFLSNPMVKPSVQAKKNAIIYDFLAEDRKKNNEICIIIDACANEDEAKEIAEFFGKRINSTPDIGKLRFSYAYEIKDNKVRVILSGYEDVVMNLVNEYYSR